MCAPHVTGATLLSRARFHRPTGWHSQRGGQKSAPCYVCGCSRFWLGSVSALLTYYGDNAAVQPGTLQELMLHETAVSWIRYRENKSRVQRPWEETVAEFTSRFKGIAQDINDNLDVDSLCRALPKRVQLLVDAEGDRIRK